MHNGFDGAALDIQEIMRMLPHRFPFLLVDRIVRCVPDREIVGVKNVTRHEFSSSDPRTGLPRYLVLEALAQTAVILTFKSLNLEPAGDELIFFAGIDNARFYGVVMPGDQMELECTIVRLMPSRGIGKFSTRARIGGQVVAHATMIAALQLPRSPARLR